MGLCIFPLVFYIAGVDIHFNDRLGKLKISDEGIKLRDELVVENFFSRRIPFCGVFGVGSSFPGVNVIIQPSNLDLIVFLIVQIFVLYGIYLLYKLKRVGGFWFIGAQLFFLIYASFFGPISKIGLSTILLPVTFFMCVYIVLVILIPFYYSEKFK